MIIFSNVLLRELEPYASRPKELPLESILGSLYRFQCEKIPDSAVNAAIDERGRMEEIISTLKTPKAHIGNCTIVKFLLRRLENMSFHQKMIKF